MKYYDIFQSPLGALTIASDGENITGLWIEGQKHFKLSADCVQSSAIAVIEDAKHWLHDYFAGKQPALTHIPLLPAGTDFQQHVWQILVTIPYGQTVTYGQIAAMLGKEKMSAQAVGNAVGKKDRKSVV